MIFTRGLSRPGVTRLCLGERRAVGRREFDGPSIHVASNFPHFQRPAIFGREPLQMPLRWKHRRKHILHGCNKRTRSTERGKKVGQHVRYMGCAPGRGSVGIKVVKEQHSEHGKTISRQSGRQDRKEEKNVHVHRKNAKMQAKTPLPAVSGRI